MLLFYLKADNINLSFRYKMSIGKTQKKKTLKKKA